MKQKLMEKMDQSNTQKKKKLVKRTGSNNYSEDNIEQEDNEPKSAGLKTKSHFSGGKKTNNG